MSQIGEKTRVLSIDEYDPNTHWVEVNYCYPDGLPVVGRYIATDGDGLEYRGRLNDKGGLCLNYLPAGSVSVELIPMVEDKALTHLRNEIKMALIHILAERQEETKQSEAELARKSTAGQRGAIAGAMGKGLWNGAVGLVEFVWGAAKTAAEIAWYLTPIERLNNLLEASYKTYQSGSLTEEKWRQSLIKNLQQAELDDIARIIGFDPRKFDPKLITEAYEITSLIAADAETLHLFTTFAKQYAGAQSTLDWAEFAGGGVFEIVLSALLIAFTGGVGVAA